MLAYLLPANEASTRDRPCSGYPLGVLPADVSASFSVEAEWILRCRTSSGALASYPDLQRLDPYLGSFAAAGLLSAGSLLGEERYLEAAAAHLEWYASAQDASGFVTDFVLEGGEYLSTGDMDSTDGYAGMFLVALERLAALTAPLPPTLLPAAHLAVAAIEATQDGDGLTWAKPSWPVKYLMDQVEALAGLRAAVSTALRLDDLDLAERATRVAAALEEGLGSLWDEASASYVWAVHSDGARVPLQRSEFYPGSVSQLWPVAFDLLPSDRAGLLVDRFLFDHPSWWSPPLAVPGKVEFWPVVASALTRTGRSTEALEGLKGISAYAFSTDRAWPYNAGTAGQFLSALAGLRS